MAEKEAIYTLYKTEQAKKEARRLLCVSARPLSLFVGKMSGELEENFFHGLLD